MKLIGLSSEMQFELTRICRVHVIDPINGVIIRRTEKGEWIMEVLENKPTKRGAKDK